MKSLCLVLLLLLPMAAISQKSADQLARMAFSACIKGDEKGFRRLYPPEFILVSYFKQSDKKKTFPKEVMKQCYPKGVSGAISGFKLFQRAIKEFGLNTKDISVTGSDTVENDIEIMKGGKKVGAVYNKIISLYFTSAGKKYAFVVPKAIEFKTRWFIGDQFVSLHEL